MMSGNHILFISSWYPNRNNPTHGLFNTVFAEAASLYNKISVLHVCSEEALQTDFEIVESTHHHIHTCIVYYKKVKNNLPGISQMLKRQKLIRGFEIGYQQLIKAAGTPNLIQLNVAMPAGIGAMYLSEKYNIPFVMNEGWSGYYPEDGNYKGFFLKQVTKKIISKARVIMPVSEGLKSAMLSHGLKGRYVVVPNALDDGLFRISPGQPRLITKFLHISSLNDTEKNVSGIIRAFSEAYKINTNIELNIVGDGGDIHSLMDLAKTLKMNAVIRFKGRIMGQALVNEINANDALVAFSNYETFGITVIEALACGKPVITALSGGVDHLITPQLGFVVKKKDEKSLTDSMLLLSKTKDKFDPQVLRNFVTDRFTIKQIGRKLTEIYNSITAK